MRVFLRIALTLLAVAVLATPAFSQPLQSNCPLTLVATNPPASSIALSPHGAFRSGNNVYVLRGQTLTTYNVTDLGDMQIAREDFISNLAGRTSIGGTAFSGGYLYVSSEAGLEVYDLRNVRTGGTAPAFVTRTTGLNYRRLAVSGSTLAGLYPGTDLPCAPAPLACFTSIDLFSIANPAPPVKTGSITTQNTFLGSFNDIAFNFANLVVTGNQGTFVFDISSPSTPRRVAADPTVGTFLVSNGTNLVGVGSDNQILTFAINSPGALSPLTLHTTASLQVGRANRIVFHPQAFIDDGLRLITMIDEIDPARLVPARTIAFDVFDYLVTMFEGRDPRVYESVSYIQQDEVKWNPIAVGPLVYVVGDVSGLQTYGDCGQMAGRIEFDSPAALPCGGAELHGWVTGATKITSVEIFLDGTSLGFANLSGSPRLDVPSQTPVNTWRLGVLLDATARGEHLIRAVGVDSNNNRRQFAYTRVFFPGTGQNCSNRRRSAGRG